MHAYKMRDTEVAMCHAPVEKLQARSTIGLPDSMGIVSAHQRPFEGENHKNENTQPYSPEVRCRQVRVLPLEKKETNE